MHNEGEIIMALSIPGGVPAQLADTTAHVQAKSKPAPQTQLPTDTVTLSLSVQVSQLALQGQSPSEIAQSLGILQSTVDSDLSISG
jgi:DNA-binding NarL/FixJ family response regulator